MKCRGEKSKFRRLLPASSRGLWQLPIAFNQAQLIHENALTPISFYPFFWFPSLQTCFLLSILIYRAFGWYFILLPACAFG
jgi:hypothetical protein